MSDRENFEEAAARLGYNLTMAEHETGEYHYPVTQDAWLIWQESQEQAARAQDEEPLGFVQSDGLRSLMQGHPARVYPVGVAPSPFKTRTFVYTRPPAQPDTDQSAKDNAVQQAQIWAQEARTQQSIVREIGELVGCDEDWRMVSAVREALGAQPADGVSLSSNPGALSSKPADGVPSGWKIARMAHLQNAIGSGPAISLSGPNNEILTFVSDSDDRSERETYAFFDALLTTTTKPDEWVSCAERLPTEADADCEGVVWCTDRDIVYSAFYAHVERSDTHYWMPTGLTRPQPPTAQKEG